MTLHASVSMGWVNTVLHTAETLGVPRQQLLQQAGLGLADLQRPRWPIDHITRLWRAAERCTQDPGLGLKVGAQAGPASFNVVGYALQSAPNLRAAVALVQQYQRLISDGGRFQMLAGDTASWLIYHPRQGALAFSPHQIEAVLATVVRFASWVTGQAVQPLAVQLNQPRLGPLAGYRAVFACPVAFEQAFSGVLLANTVLDAPLPQANAQLAHIHRQHATERLQALSTSQDVTAELRAWLQASLPLAPPTRRQAAQALGVSERSLARRLHAQQVSFTQLLDSVRREAALHAVGQTTQPLADIGAQLGFAEPAVFWRAFKRWTGLTPAQWREQSLTAPHADCG